MLSLPFEYSYAVMQYRSESILTNFSLRIVLFRNFSKLSPPLDALKRTLPFFKKGSCESAVLFENFMGSYFLAIPHI
jgi:hypothetical protein